MAECPECSVAYNSTTHRLIKEGCGHDKCRQCLLGTDTGCPQCEVEWTEQQQKTEIPGSVQIEVHYTDGDYWAANDVEPDVVEHVEQEHVDGEDLIEDGAAEEVHGEEIELVSEVETPANDDEHGLPSPLLSEQADIFPPPSSTTTAGRQKRETDSKKAAVIANDAASGASSDETNSPASIAPRRKKTFTEENMPQHLRKLAPRAENRAYFECTICMKQLARSTFSYHIYCDPSIPKPFPCTQCDKSFRTADHFRYHVNSHSAASAAALQCDSCAKAFRNKSTLAAHVRQTHSGLPAPFSCGACDKSFFSAAKFKQHETAHSDALPFECRVCPRRFRLKENMLKHLNITHTDRKPFACDRCDMHFKRVGAYKKHMTRAHVAGGGAPLVTVHCKDCGKGFTHSTMLRRHEREHLDLVQEFHCRLCTVKCTRRDNMVRHMRMMHFEGDAMKDPEPYMAVRERVKDEPELAPLTETAGDHEVQFVEGIDFEIVEQAEEVEDEELANWQREMLVEEDTELAQRAEDAFAAEDDEVQERKSSVIIYVGASSRGSGAGRKKRARPKEDELEGMPSDKMELYRDILMPGRRTKK